MDKAALHGLQFRPGFRIDAPDPQVQVVDSYAQFGPWLLREFTPRFHRPVGVKPEVGLAKTTMRINETIDGTVFERWRDNPAYRPRNLADWAMRMQVDPGKLTGAVLALYPTVTVP